MITFRPRLWVGVTGCYYKIIPVFQITVKKADQEIIHYPEIFKLPFLPWLLIYYLKRGRR
jgi:hypothetical protein